MAAHLDLPGVREFTDRLNERLRQCENGEGMLCSSLDEKINYHVQLCRDLRAYINDWAKAIFTGQATSDTAVENLLKAEIHQLLTHSKQVAALGRAMDGQCFVLQGLNALHGHIVDFDYLLTNWVSPRPAVSPGPRVKLSPAAEQHIGERIQKLSASHSK